MTAGLPGFTVHYAMKCNPHPEILAELHGLGCRFEVASAPELDLLADAGVDPADTLFSNPVKPVGHIARAHAKGLWRFAFDSEDELDKLAAVAPGAAVYVRLAAHQIRSGVPSEGKFGVDTETAIGLLLGARDRGLARSASPSTSGSQMLLPQAWRAPLRAVGQVMDKLAAEQVFLRMVERRRRLPRPLRHAPCRLCRSTRRRSRLAWPDCPTRSRSSSSPAARWSPRPGPCVATVIGTALRHGGRWVAPGRRRVQRADGEPGDRQPAPLPGHRLAAAPARDRCHLTGPTCDSQDTIMFDVELSAGLRTGDEVYIGSTGSYTSVYASSFNGFDPPVVRCVRGAGA